MSHESNDENAAPDAGTDEGRPISNRLLWSVLRVEHNYMTLRTPKGWLLWSQKVTSEATLDEVLAAATPNLDYNQGT